MGELNVEQEAPVRVAVVIVHYRTPELLRDCLESLRGQVDPECDRVVVVENGSGDGSEKAVREMCLDREGIMLIESEKNLGFAGGNNVGLEAVQARYYLLLNPDTVVRPGALELLRGFLEAHPEASMVGPRLEYPDGTGQLSSFGDPTPLGEFLRGSNFGPINRLFKRWLVYGDIPTDTRQVDWVAGACVLIRAAVLEAVEGLDARYFMYFEEVDFCRRARLAGFTCWYFPEARVVHLVGQASGVTTAWEQRRLPRYWFESRHRYFRKHFGYFGALAADVGWLAGHGLMQVRRLLTGVSRSPCAKCETRDFLRHEGRLLCGGVRS